jgi:protein-disulfide isomerase
VWKRLDSLLTVLTWVVVLVVSYLALRPEGVLGAKLADWRLQRHLSQVLHDRWGEMTGLAPRLDVGRGAVQVVEFGDYQCPSCRRVDDMLAAVLTEHRGIGIVFHNYPLPIHPAAEGAARASICAREQGLFHEMHRRLFGTVKWQVDSNWTSEARVIGIPDLKRFGGCLHASSTDQLLMHEKALGDSLGVQGTPAFFTSSKRWIGLISSEQLLRLVGEDSTTRR